MARITTYAIGVLLLATACSTGSDDASLRDLDLGSELVSNGGFEDGVSVARNWAVTAPESGQSAIVTVDGSGNRYVSMSAQLVEDASWPQAVLEDRFTIAPGGRYVLSLNARSDDFGLVIPIVWFDDASGNTIEGKGPGTVTVDSADWSTHTFEVIAPDLAAEAFILFRLALNTSVTNEPSLTIDIDNISLRRVLD